MSRPTTGVAVGWTVVLALAALAAVLLPQPATAEDTPEAYEIALATVQQAQRICPGLSPNVPRMTLLRGLADTSDKEAMASALFVRAKGLVADELARKGRSGWCAAAASAFGPGGVLIPGLLDVR